MKINILNKKYKFYNINKNLLQHHEVLNTTSRGGSFGLLPAIIDGWRRRSRAEWQPAAVTLLMVNFRQPSHEFTFGVGMTFISYPLVLTP
jgi:hypothetical protein